MTVPRRLSRVPASPYHDTEACDQVDKVLVDGVHLPNCVAYDMDAGWAFNQVNGVWQSKVYGMVTVTEKRIINAVNDTHKKNSA